MTLVAYTKRDRYNYTYPCRTGADRGLLGAHNIFVLLFLLASLISEHTVYFVTGAVWSVQALVVWLVCAAMRSAAQNSNVDGNGLSCPGQIWGAVWNQTYFYCLSFTEERKRLWLCGRCSLSLEKDMRIIYMMSGTWFDYSVRDSCQRTWEETGKCLKYSTHIAQI